MEDGLHGRSLLLNRFVNRVVMDACRIGSHDLPPGVVVQADVWSLHHDSALWGEDPESFKPERLVKIIISWLVGCV